MSTTWGTLTTRVVANLISPSAGCLNQISRFLFMAEREAEDRLEWKAMRTELFVSPIQGTQGVVLVSVPFGTYLRTYRREPYLIRRTSTARYIAAQPVGFGPFQFDSLAFSTSLTLGPILTYSSTAGIPPGKTSVFWQFSAGNVVKFYGAPNGWGDLLRDDVVFTVAQITAHTIVFQYSASLTTSSNSVSIPPGFSFAVITNSMKANPIHWVTPEDSFRLYSDADTPNTPRHIQFLNLDQNGVPRYRIFPPSDIGQPSSGDFYDIRIPVLVSLLPTLDFQDPGSSYTNWFTNNASEYLVDRATSLAFDFDRDFAGRDQYGTRAETRLRMSSSADKRGEGHATTLGVFSGTSDRAVSRRRLF